MTSTLFLYLISGVKAQYDKKVLSLFYRLNICARFNPPLKLSILLLLVIYAGEASSQNLVPNAGFEEHSEIRYPWQELEISMTTWKQSGFLPVIFDTRFKALKSDIEKGYDLKKYPPHSGHSMIQLRFFANTQVRCPEGGGAYVQTKLKQPLDTAQIYAVSYWVYMNKTEALDLQPDLPYYFGLALDEKNFYFANSHCLYESEQVLRLKNVEREVWHQVHCVIRPRKNYTHLMFGVFQDPYHPIVVNNKRFDKRNHYEQEFFIDDIIIESIKTDSGVMVFPPIPTQRKVYPKVQNFSDDWTVYFETGADALSAASQLKLDSLWLQMQADTSFIYEITGHTDNIGDDNSVLSMQRAMAVYHYLTQKTPAFQYRLRYSGVADSLPSAPNTDTGQPLNRRVEIHRTRISQPQNLYYLASEFAKKQQSEEAFRHISLWLKSGKADPILLLFDPELLVLHSDPKWPQIEKAVKQHYQRHQKSGYAFQLDYLYCQDQWFRSLGREYEDAKGYTPAVMDTMSLENLDTVTEKPDSMVLSQLIRLIDREGWPLLSEVGKRPAQAAVLMILHARDVKVMQKYLPILENACKKGEGKWIDFATLTDRTRLNSSQKQLYGTQYSSQPADPNYFELSPLENSEKMNEYRAQLGLSPVQATSFRVVRDKQ